MVNACALGIDTFFDCPLHISVQDIKLDGSCASGTGPISMLFSSPYCRERLANAHLPALSIATQESRTGRDPILPRRGSSPRRPNGLAMPPHLSARPKKLAPLLSAGTRQPVRGLGKAEYRSSTGVCPVFGVARIDVTF